MNNIFFYREVSNIGEYDTICYIIGLWKSLITIEILGGLSYSAQQVCFDAEKLGCPISQQLYTLLINYFQ